VKKLKIYLDTSAIGYLDEQSSPQEMGEMLKLWELIKQGIYDAAISQITFDEISNNKNAEKVDVLLDYISEINYEKIEISEQANRIASLIASAGVLAEKHKNDRLHIGCAIAANCEIIVSLNFKHLVNIKTIKGVRGIANLEGYSSIDIVSPAMLTQEGDV